MGMGSWWHWLIVLVVVLLLFGGGGKIPRLMRDMGEGITAFRKGLKKNEGEQPTDAAAGTPGEANAALQPSSAPASPSAAGGTPSGQAAQNGSAGQSVKS